MKTILEHEGKKYIMPVIGLPGLEPITTGGRVVGVYADVYAVLRAAQVTCPARQQAIKKLLFAGRRGKGSEMDDLRGAEAALSRAMEVQNDLEGRAAEAKSCLAADLEEAKKKWMGAVGVAPNGEAAPEETIEQLRQRVRSLGETHRKRTEAIARVKSLREKYLSPKGDEDDHLDMMNSIKEL